MTTPIRTINLRERIIGIDEQVPLLDGSRVPYVNLDNAASTPPLQDVMDELSRSRPRDGWTRMTSIGSSKNTADIDRMMEMLEWVAANDYQGDYQVDIASGEYLPVAYEEPILDFLPLGMNST